MNGIRVLPASTPGLAVLDQRYIQRFVNGILTGETAEIAGQRTLYNPSGPVMGGMPEDTSAALFNPDVGGRFATQVHILRATSSGAASPTSVRQYRARGTVQNPTSALNGDWLASYAAGTFFDDTQALGSVADITWIARENQGSGNRGGEWVIRGAGVGSPTISNLLFIRRNSAGSETQLQSGLGDLSFIPLVSGRLRNPTNTASLIEWTATGIGEYGAAPVAKPTITGSRGGNVALANLLAALALRGSLTDATTP